MPSIGPMEILVVAIIALIVFGPRRLPEIARSVGKAFSEFRKQAGEVRDEFETSLRIEEETPERESRDRPSGSATAAKAAPEDDGTHDQ